MKKNLLIPAILSVAAGACSKADLSDLPGGNGGEAMAFSEINGVDFDEVVLGDTKQKEVTLRNNGRIDLKDLLISYELNSQFSLVENSCPSILSPGAECKIKFSFSSLDSLSALGSYKIEYTENNAQKAKIFNIKAKAVTPAILAFNQNAFDFGGVAIRGKKAIKLEIKNTGGATAKNLKNTLVGSKFSFAGGSFPGTDGNCSDKLPGNSSCFISLNVSPSEEIPHVGLISIEYFDGKTQQNVEPAQLSAVGKKPASVSNLNLSVFFDQTIVGDSKVKQIVLQNSGEVDAKLNSVKVDGEGFSLVSAAEGACQDALAPNSSCVYEVKYTPTRESEVQGSFELSYNDGVTDRSSTSLIYSSSVMPASLKLAGSSPADFGVSTIGIKTVKEILVENTGGKAATNLNYSLSGNFSFQGGVFPGSGGTCGQELAGKSSCSVVVSHIPSLVGADSSNLVVGYNNGLSEVVSNLKLQASASGLASLVFPQGESLVLGIFDFGTTKLVPVQIKNLGQSAATNVVVSQKNHLGKATEQSLSVANNCSSIGSGDTCELSIGVPGDELGQTSTEVSVSYIDASGAQRKNLIRLNGSSEIISTIMADVPSLNFGTVLASSVNQLSVVLTNTGTTKITGITPLIAAQDVSVSGGDCGQELLSTQSCSVNLSYSPLARGEMNGSVSFSYFNEVESKSVSIGLSGVSQAPANLIASSSQLSFGTIATQTEAQLDLTISNNGDVSADSVLASIPSPFRLVETSCSTNLLAGQSCLSKLAYSPEVAGVSSAQYSLSYNNGVEAKALLVDLSGSAKNVAKLALAEASAHDFGIVFVGEPSEKVFTITNNGAESASSLTFTSSDPRVSLVSGNCGQELLGGSTCQVTFAYAPLVEGETLQSSVSISFNDGIAARSQALSFTGVGGEARLGSLALNSNAVDFGEVAINATGTVVLTATNNGNGRVRALAFAGLQAPFSRVPHVGAEQDCGVEILAGQSCAISLKFEPADRAVYSGSLNVSYNTGLTLQNITVSIAGRGTFIPGTVDPTFGTNGLATFIVPGSESSYASGLFVQGDGKIVIGGTANVPLLEGHSFVTRLMPDGQLDSTYANLGYTLDNANGLGAVSFKSIKAANGGMFHFGAAVRNFLVSKMGPNGLPAANFGLGGSVVQPLVKRPDYAYSGLELPNGKVLSVGTWNEDIFVTRMMPNGSPDTTFNGTGSISFDLGLLAIDELRFVGVQSTGKIITGGGSGFATLIRFNDDGTPDGTFGLGGVKLITGIGNVSSYIRDAVVLNDNKVLALVLAQNSPILDDHAPIEMFLARFTSEGELDETFGLNGTGFIRVADWLTTGYTADFQMKIQGDGKILIAGNKGTLNLNAVFFEMALIRLMPDGQIDTAFGTNGTYVVPDSLSSGTIEAPGDHSIALEIQPDGDIVLGGKKSVGVGLDSVVVTRIRK